MNRFPNATSNETAEQGDVGIGDVVIADAAPPAVADVIFTEEVVFVDIPLRPVGRGPLP